MLRPVRPGDAAALHRRRNDPRVAEWQSWSLPFAPDRAEALIADSMGLSGPTDDQWWMATLADADDRTVLGDLVVRPTWSGRAAEVGYSLDRAAWGNGYATEALDMLLAWLWTEPSLTRVHATLHPDNTPSAMVLERTGFRFEGHTRNSYWVGEVNSDDWLYGMTREDWTDWRSRPRSAPTSVELIEITRSNVAAVRRLVTHRTQERFVSSVDDSLASALIPPIYDTAPARPWPRAVVVDGDLVGFVMLAVVTEHHREPALWRLLIDRRHQRRGIGRRVIELAIDECRAMGAASVRVYWREGRGSPGPLYRTCGFVPTGRSLGGDIEARLMLS